MGALIHLDQLKAAVPGLIVGNLHLTAHCLNDKIGHRYYNLLPFANQLSSFKDASRSAKQGAETKAERKEAKN